MGPLGLKAPILGRHVSVYSSILCSVRYYIRLCALLYLVACATLLTENIYFQNLLYAFAVDGLACRTIQCVHYGVRLRLRGPWGEGA